MRVIRAIYWVSAIWLALPFALLPAMAQSPSCAMTTQAVGEPLNACMGQDSVTIAAVGDVLLHGVLQRTAYRQDDGFVALWRDVVPYLEQADIAFANLEGPTAPGIAKNLRTHRDPGLRYDNDVYSSYPLFNYHPRLIADLKQSGFDIVSTANNHALDRGSRGAVKTIEHLRQNGLRYTGTIEPEAPRDFVSYVPSRLGKIAFIGCSYSTNGLRDRYRQVLLCYKDRDELIDMVRQLAQMSDIAAIIVAPHWGFEYQHRPNTRQQNLGKALVDAGATAVIGTHAHVVQSWELTPSRLEDQRPVLYATGNFVSGQVRFPRRVGALAWLQLCRAPIEMDLGLAINDKLRLGRLGWMPLLMQRTARGPKLVPVLGDNLKGEFRAAQKLMAKYVPPSGVRFHRECSEGN